MTPNRRVPLEVIADLQGLEFENQSPKREKEGDPGEDEHPEEPDLRPCSMGDRRQETHPPERSGRSMGSWVYPHTVMSSHHLARVRDDQLAGKMDQQDGHHHAPKAHRKVYQPKGVSSYRWGKKDLAGLEHAPVIADHAQDQRRDESVRHQALIKTSAGWMANSLSVCQATASTDVAFHYCSTMGRR